MKKNQLIITIAILVLGGITVSCEKDMVNNDSLGVDLKKAKTKLLPQGSLTYMEWLGKNMFFDKNLSVNGKMSCATCHAPEVGWTGPDEVVNLATGVYPGTIHSRSGDRKPPTAAYGGESPVLYFDDVEGLWIGGMFWDGRATGWTLGDPLAEQAMGPFLNPVEQAVPNAKLIVIKVAHSAYAGLFESVWGKGSLDFIRDVEGTYERIVRSISEYEKSPEVNPFSSKYDAYLAGTADLTEQEAWGLELFEGKGMCALCHLSQPDVHGNPPLFTDFTFDNLGIPKNPNNPIYTASSSFNPDGFDRVDLGLGGFLMSIGEPYEDEIGKHKVPTLRNVDKRPYDSFVKVFGHNGYFKSLEEITHFYNTRDVESAGWPEAEVPATVNDEELGDLNLTVDEEAAIVAFMKTLSDGYRVK